MTSGLPIREADLNTNKKVGIKVEADLSFTEYKQAIALKELGYEVDLELSCRIVIKHSGEQR